MSGSRAVPAGPVRHTVRRAAAAVSAVTLVALLYVLVFPARTAPALRWYLLIVGVIGIVAAIRAITRRYPVLWRSPADRVARVSSTGQSSQRLWAIDRLVTRARWDAAGFELELRPILRAIAAQRLATYRTIDIAADPGAARVVLGERVWRLLTPVDLETARGERGIDPDDLRVTVETLEGLRAAPHA